MSLNLEELLERVRQLEQANRRPPRRGYCNQADAARYLGESVETLRRRHALGRGPKRIRNGRYWRYAYADLDDFLAAEAPKAPASSDTAA
jgi:hypothetical protein